MLGQGIQRQANVYEQMEQITNNGTAKPLVPLLKATYDANPSTYDEQDVIWAIHETPIV